MTKTHYDSFESVRRRAGMGERLGNKDREYSYYAGASWEIASQLAVVDTVLKLKLLPKEYVPYLKIFRAYLDQQRKAFFVSVGSDVITKLGVLLGMKSDTISF